MRYCYERVIKAKDAEECAKKFAKYLLKKGVSWAAEEIQETAENGYVCMSNASRHRMVKGEVTSPSTSDWSYYWALDAQGDGVWYAWIIDRSGEV